MKTRVVVIGVGSLGRHHARILAGLPDAKLVGVCDPNEAQGPVVAAQLGVRWYPDFRDAIFACDAASIVVPTTLHRQVADAYLAAGKDIFVEKPLAGTLEAARAIVAHATANELIVQVGHSERFNPAFQAARAALFGVQYLNFERVAPYSFRSTDISVVHDLMVHDLDLANRLIGSPIQAVSSRGSRIISDHYDMVQTRIHYQSGAIADFRASRVHPVAKRQFEVWGEAGWLSVDLHNRQLQHMRPTAELKAAPPRLDERTATPEERLRWKDDVYPRYLSLTDTTVEPCDALTAELAEFVTCCRTRRRPEVSGADGLKAVEAAELVTRATIGFEWTALPASIAAPAAAVPVTDGASASPQRRAA